MSEPLNNIFSFYTRFLLCDPIHLHFFVVLSQVLSGLQICIFCLSHTRRNIEVVTSRTERQNMIMSASLAEGRVRYFLDLLT